MPTNNKSKANMMHRNIKEDNTYLSPDGIGSILVSGEDTNGEFCIVHCSAKKDAGPPTHIHENEDESFYVLDGEMTVFVGDKTLSAKTGDYVFLPRGIPHTFKVTSSEIKFLVTAYPAGFDSFVKETCVPYKEGVKFPELSPEVIQRGVEISKRYGISYPNLNL
ncbi:quercetin 2,3-dioxygenase [Bacillus mycoides]|uniref:quercetin 2,3-dioxygenase n=1 Tax=Bacillus mycoides TaxID=1405 RepID=UPI0011AAAA03|nr:quercetin 2,3-dioxygenase [Bacillus mycoides]